MAAKGKCNGESGASQPHAKTTDAAQTTPMGEIGDVAEFLQLEEEHRDLRKPFSEKRRAENADLRKRLHLG
ncbi:hypothetical protein [Neorhizobium sp. T25_13]|uniref:hypothetical protein n=1 Tax=Neorhizobium sp. T25_13 TaxID=2093830 RepID=UPI00155F295C